jgi:cytoskeletal protein CcmA (bactofilin family)
MALFGKDAPSPQKPAPQKSDSAASGGTSYLGPNIVFDGKLSGDESLIIEGHLKGEVDLKNDLKVGRGARVEAVVHARNVSVEGTVVGDLSADNRVELFNSAHVDGNIRAPKIVVAEGAKFRGAVDMGSSKGKSGSPQPGESKEKV